MGFLGRIVIVALVLGAWATAPLAGAAPLVRQDDQQLTIAFSVPYLAPFFVHMLAKAEEAAAEIGNIELIRLDGQDDSSKQSADLEAMVTQGVDGIIVSPKDVEALAPAIQSVVDAGIPLVTVDRNVIGVDTLAHVGADNVRGGELQGEYVLGILPDGGKIFELLGQPGASPAIDRDTGLKNVLGNQDAVEIVFEQTANFAKAEAVTIVEAGLAANPEPDAIVAANDDMALGAAEATTAAGLDVPIIGFDALPEALQAIEAGTLAATVEQFPGRQAATALQILVDNLRDGTMPAEHDTYLEPKLITRDNLGEAERAEEAGITPGGTPGAGTPIARTSGASPERLGVLLNVATARPTGLAT